MADLSKGKQPDDDRPTTGFRGLLYRLGILITPAEKERLRKMTMQERMLDQSIPQLLVAVPFVVLLGGAYKGWTGATYALVGSLVVVVALSLYQSSQDGGPR